MKHNNILFFTSPAAWRKWLEKHHANRDEQWLGFHKKATGKPTITWRESVIEALCFGWIDGVRHGIDAGSYKIRFTPRRPRSIWSAVNVKLVDELTTKGLMRPAGLAAFALCDRTKAYSYERLRDAKLSPKDQKLLSANRAAWAYFKSRPPSYQKAAAWWVTSAKQEATRARRLARLIEDSAHERPIQPLKPRTSK